MNLSVSCFIRDHAPMLASPTQILRNVEKIAIPAIVLASLASLPVVSADYATCFHDCAVEQKVLPAICAVLCAFNT